MPSASMKEAARKLMEKAGYLRPSDGKTGVRRCKVSPASRASKAAVPPRKPAVSRTLAALASAK